MKAVTIGNAILYCGDCREVLPTLDSVDVTITDPPYSESVHKGSRTRNDDDPGLLVTFDHIEDDDIVSIASALIEKSKRWVVMTCDWTHATRFLDAGLPFIRLGAWVKPNSAPQFTGDRPGVGWESVAVLHRPGKKHWNGGGKRAVWTYPTEPGEHPTQKPLPLIQQWVSDFSEPGEIIFDPFMGSGTTGVAALKLGRRFIGVERDPKYFELAIKRIEAARAQPDLFLSESKQEALL